jgi:formate/nitrite transporter FocA (FNT family)
LGETAGGEGEPTSLSSASKLSDSSQQVRQAVEASSRPGAALIHETIRAEGESELDRTVSALLLSGFAAGLSMGLSLVVQGLLQARLPEAPWRILISGSGYCVGFVIVVLGRQQLFTENTLTPILPLLYHRNGRTLWRVTRLWSLVLLANIAATWAIAALLAHTSAFAPDVQASFAEISNHAIEHPFGTTFIKGIFAGWLIALMVWLLPAVGPSGILVVVIVTYVIGIGSLSHVIAGSVDVFYLLEKGVAGWTDYIARFFVPTLLGNVVGGVALVAVLNYGQVADEVH